MRQLQIPGNISSLKIPFEIKVSFHFANFRAMTVQFNFKKSKFGNHKNSIMAIDVQNYYWPE